MPESPRRAQGRDSRLRRSRTPSPRPPPSKPTGGGGDLSARRGFAADEEASCPPGGPPPPLRRGGGEQKRRRELSCCCGHLSQSVLGEVEKTSRRDGSFVTPARFSGEGPPSEHGAGRCVHAASRNVRHHGDVAAGEWDPRRVLTSPWERGISVPAAPIPPESAQLLDFSEDKHPRASPPPLADRTVTGNLRRAQNDVPAPCIGAGTAPCETRGDGSLIPARHWWNARGRPHLTRRAGNGDSGIRI